ncbi:hypothetical protein MPL3365_140195 [Mesorhizobium plurifarium]|uniref:Uncharacterized protein n=1 Tax=Mesorhizobium plurifarium TaxID=69974 RepID=A0A090GT42_MESPL|nr:hypothetical protein MPL3365_140195 [Mesorhizobium plurifarium]
MESCLTHVILKRRLGVAPGEFVHEAGVIELVGASFAKLTGKLNQHFVARYIAPFEHQGLPDVAEIKIAGGWRLQPCCLDRKAGRP